jgi:hypothetical protein
MSKTPRQPITRFVGPQGLYQARGSARINIRCRKNFQFSTTDFDKSLSRYEYTGTSSVVMPVIASPRRRVAGQDQIVAGTEFAGRGRTAGRAAAVYEALSAMCSHRNTNQR